MSAKISSVNIPDFFLMEITVLKRKMTKNDYINFKFLDSILEGKPSHIDHLTDLMST